MSEIYKIILTSCLTVFGGIVVFVIGQIIVKFFIEPINEQKRLIGEIVDSLIFYAYEYANPGIGKPRMDKGATEASTVLRRNGTQLISRTNFIPCYLLWSFLGIVRKRKDIEDAYKGLIILSNAISKGDPIANVEKSKQIRKSLGIRVNDQSNKEEGRAS